MPVERRAGRRKGARNGAPSAKHHSLFRNALIGNAAYVKNTIAITIVTGTTQGCAGLPVTGFGRFGEIPIGRIGRPTAWVVYRGTIVILLTRIPRRIVTTTDFKGGSLGKSRKTEKRERKQRKTCS
jgi:hypothetical protein